MTAERTIVIVNVAAMKAATALTPLAETRVKRHRTPRVSPWNQTITQLITSIYTYRITVITLDPIRFLRPCYYRLIEIIHRPVPGARMVLRVNRDWQRQGSVTSIGLTAAKECPLGLAIPLHNLIVYSGRRCMRLEYKKKKIVANGETRALQREKIDSEINET